MSDLTEILERMEQEVCRLDAERRALETRCDALRQTEAELTARIGNHQKNLVVKKRLEELQAAVRKWVEAH
jgi:seryl-tRNA synthetase